MYNEIKMEKFYIYNNRNNSIHEESLVRIEKRIYFNTHLLEN